MARKIKRDMAKSTEHRYIIKNLVVVDHMINSFMTSPKKSKCNRPITLKYKYIQHICPSLKIHVFRSIRGSSVSNFGFKLASFFGYFLQWKLETLMSANKPWCDHSWHTNCFSPSFLVRKISILIGRLTVKNPLCVREWLVENFHKKFFIILVPN